MPESDFRKRPNQKNKKCYKYEHHDLKRMVSPGFLFRSQAAFVESNSGYYFAAYVASAGLAIQQNISC
jgi:hypothetical protein